MSILQKIAEIETEMARTQKNKATNFHLGLLKAKLAKLRAQLIEGTSKGGGGGTSDGFDVSKTGDARVGLIGFPSVGKSTLLTKLTGTFSEVAAYEFTTLTCVPGVFKYKGARVQLLDLPGIIEGAKDGKGRGRQVVAVARTCGLILIVLDATKPLVHKRLIEKELEGFGIRLNKKPPAILFKKRDKGGVAITATVPLTQIDEDTVRSICHEYRIPNATFSIRCDATADDVIDVIEGNRIYVPALYLLNKIDQITLEELDLLVEIPHSVPISAHYEWNLDGLIEKMWNYLDLIRVYTKPRGQVPDYEAPVIVKRGHSRVEDFCTRIHKQLLEQFKYALVWGRSVKHMPQKVGRDHQLVDEDVVQVVKNFDYCQFDPPEIRLHPDNTTTTYAQPTAVPMPHSLPPQFVPPPWLQTPSPYQMPPSQQHHLLQQQQLQLQQQQLSGGRVFSRRAALRARRVEEGRGGGLDWLADQGRTVLSAGRGLTEQLSESVSVLKRRWQEARGHILDWIYSGPEEHLGALPPCPPITTLFCSCAEPGQIKAIEGPPCESCGGREWAQCLSCLCPTSNCPHCGAPMIGRKQPVDFLVRKIENLLRADCCLPQTPDFPRDPLLVVTRVGPFREANTAMGMPCPPDCSFAAPCRNLAFQCGRFLNARLPCCEREAPPAPRPPRPLQRLFPGCFPPPSKPSKYSYLRGSPVIDGALRMIGCPPPQRPKAPRTGLAGALEDFLYLSLALINNTLASTADVADHTCIPHTPGSIPCDCAPPPLRYPKNGFYDEPPDPPTRSTGCRAIDALNNFLDAVAVPPKSLDETVLEQPPEIPETESTGVQIIDQVNGLLDALFPPPNSASDPAELLAQREPFKALQSLLRPPKVTVPEERPSKGSEILDMIESVTTAMGRRDLLNCSSDCGRIDYVNFDVVPGRHQTTEMNNQGRHGRGGDIVVPVPNDAMVFSSALSAAEVSFHSFCRLLDSIADPLKKPALKLKVLTQYLSAFDAVHGDLFPLCRLLMPQIDRQRGLYKMREANLARLYIEVFSLPHAEAECLKHFKDPSKFDVHIQATAGDFSGVVCSLLQSRLSNVDLSLTLEELNSLLDELQRADNDVTARSSVFFRLSKHLSASGHKWLVRIILKDLKLGISHERILKVLHPKALEVFNQSSDLEETLTKLKNITDQTEKIVKDEEAPSSELSKNLSLVHLFQPFKPMLAKRLNPSDIHTLFQTHKVEVTRLEERLGEERLGGGEYFLEPKFDGERILCHIDRMTSMPHRVALFTRRSNDYTSHYEKALREVLLSNIKGGQVILDGEVVAWNDKTSDFIPFGLNRQVAQGEVEGAALAYIVFDVLFFANDQGAFDLTSNPLEERRKFLKRIVTPKPSRLLITSYERVRDSQTVNERLDAVTKNKKEGLMLKDVASLYFLNARNRGWFKLKPIYGALADTLDLLVIGAYFSDTSKRREKSSIHLSDHVSTFLCAVIDQRDPSKAVSFCKVGTGYSLSELDQMRMLLKPYLSRYTGPLSAPYLNPTFRFGRNERPDLVVDCVSHGFVMEVEAAEIVKSSSFEAGYTLRFPRAKVPIRNDKTCTDCCTLNELLTLAKETASTSANYFATKDEIHIKKEPSNIDSEEEQSEAAVKKSSPSGWFSSEGLADSLYRYKGASGGLLGSFRHAYRSAMKGQSSSVLEGIEVFVLGGSYVFPSVGVSSKADLERLIVRNGGLVRENVQSDMAGFYVVAQRPDFRTREIHRRNPEVTIVSAQYVIDCVEQNQLIDLNPLYVIHAKNSLERMFRDLFDKFGDSYFEPISADELKRLFETKAFGTALGKGHLFQWHQKGDQEEVEGMVGACSSESSLSLSPLKIRGGSQLKHSEESLQVVEKMNEKDHSNLEREDLERLNEELADQAKKEKVFYRSLKGHQIELNEQKNEKEKEGVNYVENTLINKLEENCKEIVKLRLQLRGAICDDFESPTKKRKITKNLDQLMSLDFEDTSPEERISLQEKSSNNTSDLGHLVIPACQSQQSLETIMVCDD